MASFQFIETFFFLSLGITFGLVLLLVYHFKQRISTLEQKCDTMFDIVQNVVKELGITKTNMNYLSNQIQSQTSFSAFPPMFMPNMNAVSENYENEMNLREETEEEDDDEDSEEDEYDDSSDSSDTDSDDSEEDDPIYDAVEEPNVFEKIRIENLEESVKRINIDDNLQLEDISNLENTDLEQNEKELDNEELVESVELRDIEPIVVNKLEEISESTNEVPIVENIRSTISPEIYKRMGLTDLKKMVISKGLCSDPSKMKKQELIKMLIEGEQ